MKSALLVLLFSICFITSATGQLRFTPAIVEREMRSAYLERKDELRREQALQSPIHRHRSESTKKPTPLMDGNWDNIFTYDNSINGGSIYAMVEVGDSLFVAGDFGRFKGVEAYHVALLNTKTGVVTPLDLGLSGACYALAFHDGKLYAGGAFNYAGDQYVNGLAYYENGTWHSIGMTNSTVIALAIYQGKLVVGGYFTSINAESMLGIAMYDGALWHELDGGLQFSDGYAGSAEELLVVGDSLFVGGDFSRVAGQSSYGVALWHNGWQPLANGITGAPSAMAWYDNKLYIGGDFVRGSMDDVISPFIIAWNGDSYEVVDRGYPGYVGEMAVLGNALYVGGQFRIPGSTSSGNIAKLSGGTWSAITSGTYGRVNSLAGSNGRLYVGGNFTRAGGFNAESFAAIDHGAGTWATGFTRGATDSYNRLKVDVLANTEDFLYAGGEFLRAGGKIVNHIAAWNKKTGEWSSLDGGLDGEVREITVRGKEVYVGGVFYRAGSLPVGRIAKWDEATSSWSAMGEGSERTIDAIATDAQNVYASVFFDVEGETYLSNMGRWNGAAWEVVPGGFYGYIHDMHHDNGKLYMTGSIGELDGEEMNNVAVMENDAWSPLGDGIDGRPTRITSAHGRVYAAGAIDGNFDEDIIGVMQFDGTSWSSLGAGINDYAYALNARGNSLYVGGWFDEAGGDDIQWVARWDGNRWDSLSGSLDNIPYAITSDAQSVYLGGYFSRTGGVNSWRVAKFDAEESSVRSADRVQDVLSFDPLKNTLTLVSDEIFGSIEIFDLLGRSLLRSDLVQEGNRYSIAIPDHLPPGAHLVRFSGERTVGGMFVK